MLSCYQGLKNHQVKVLSFFWQDNLILAKSESLSKKKLNHYRWNKWLMLAVQVWSLSSVIDSRTKMGFHFTLIKLWLYDLVHNKIIVRGNLAWMKNDSRNFLLHSLKTTSPRKDSLVCSTQLWKACTFTSVCIDYVLLILMWEFLEAHSCML